MTDLVGVLLAAGAGTRLGMPGGLMHAADGTPWVVSTVEYVTIVPSPDWSDGLSRSVRAGFGWAEQTDAAVALFHMVDRPEVGPAVLRRVIAAAQPAATPATTGSTPEAAPGAASVLARAGFHGRPGYPVLIGRDHWAGASAAATGDRSMGPYLKRVPCPLIPCDDLLG
jgi:molybdenum cofactor cytidylyltransferase/nicotine blue oxidoreductase